MNTDKIRKLFDGMNEDQEKQMRELLAQEIRSKVLEKVSSSSKQWQS